MEPLEDVRKSINKSELLRNCLVQPKKYAKYGCSFTNPSR